MNYITRKHGGWQYRVSRCSYCRKAEVLHIGSENYCADHATDPDGPRWQREAEDAWLNLRFYAGERLANIWHDRIWPDGNYHSDTWQDVANKLRAAGCQSPICHTNPRVQQ